MGLLRQVDRALALVHDPGKVHRDLLPGIVRVNVREVARLIDFSLTQTGKGRGLGGGQVQERQTRKEDIRGHSIRMARGERSHEEPKDAPVRVWRLGLFGPPSGGSLHADLSN